MHRMHWTFQSSCDKGRGKLSAVVPTDPIARLFFDLVLMQPYSDTHQHYVSQFMLRGFHTGNEAQIWVFEKLTGRSYTDAIRNVASEFGFYNIAGSEIDNRIRKIEDATAPIISQIRKRKTLRGLDENQRVWLSGLTALQLVRTRAFSERSQDMMRQITDAVTHLSGGRLSGDIRKQLGLDQAGTEHEKTMATILDLAREVVDELLKKMVVLFESDGSGSFWIADSPVALQNNINPGDRLRSHLGLGVPGIEVYFPVSSDLVLAHMCPSIAIVSAAMDEETRRMGFIHERGREYVRAVLNTSPILIGKREIDDLNTLQLAYAEHWVYSSEDNFEHARKILAGNPQLKTGPWYSSPQQKACGSS